METCRWCEKPTESRFKPGLVRPQGVRWKAEKGGGTVPVHPLRWPGRPHGRALRLGGPVQALHECEAEGGLSAVARVRNLHAMRGGVSIAGVPALHRVPCPATPLRATPSGPAGPGRRGGQTDQKPVQGGDRWRPENRPSRRPSRRNRSHITTQPVTHHDATGHTWPREGPESLGIIVHP